MSDITIRIDMTFSAGVFADVVADWSEDLGSLQATLAGDISADTTNIALKQAIQFVAGQSVMVDSEPMPITNVDYSPERGTVLTVVRGVLPGVPAIHRDDAKIHQLRWPSPVEKLMDECMKPYALSKVTQRAQRDASACFSVPHATFQVVK